MPKAASRIEFPDKHSPLPRSIRFPQLAAIFSIMRRKEQCATDVGHPHWTGVFMPHKEVAHHHRASGRAVAFPEFESMSVCEVCKVEC